MFAMIFEFYQFNSLFVQEKDGRFPKLFPL